MKAKQAKRNRKWKEKQGKKQKKIEEESAPMTFSKFPGFKNQKIKEDLEGNEQPENDMSWNDIDDENNENENINGYPGPDALRNVEDEEYDDDDKGSKKKKKSGGFQSMGLTMNVLKGILKRGYKVPTPIQRKVSSIDKL